MEDHIIHLGHDDCARMNDILEAVKTDKETKEMMDQIDADLELTLFPELRKMTKMPDASTDEMHNVCNYIFWARASNIKLNFVLTDQQMD